ncbi:MAG: hypothetical protein ACOYL6_18205 [Bacteriovoracaceae bacterium]
MKKIIIALIALSSISAFAVEYNCSVSYGPEMETEVRVIKDNIHGTRLQLNQSKKTAFISIQSTVNPDFQDVGIFFGELNDVSVNNMMDSVAAVTASNQQTILMTATASGKAFSLSCELK